MSLSEVQVIRDALLHNVASLRTMLPKRTAFIAVVKGNAYGHGLRQSVQALEPVVDGFQVDDIEELAALRELTSKRALLLGYVSSEDVFAAVELDSEMAIYDRERLPLISEAGARLGKRPKVHLKIDALLGRQGVTPESLNDLIDELRKYPAIELVAAYAHFANIEDTTDLGHAILQTEVFDDCWKQIKAAGWPHIGRHLSATSGLMTVEDGNDLVRVGLGVYGMYPSAALARRFANLKLRPAMRWVSHLAQVKILPPRHPIGYGLTYIAPREMRIGIVPQGYADGYDRGLSNSGEVLVKGVRRSVLGRVAMNMFAIDLTDLPEAKAEDEVVLLGSQSGDRIAAEEIASRLGTINYEITTSVSAATTAEDRLVRRWT